MTAVFADTAYWIALTNVQDADHEKTEAFSASLKPRPVLTTEAVLIEYLNYFAARGPRFRRAAAASRSCDDGHRRGAYRGAFRAGLPSRPSKQASRFTMRGLTRVTASPIAFQCRPCGAKA